MKKIYFGGDIVTMEDSLKNIEAISVEDGVISKCGSLASVMNAKKDYEMIDLKGMSLLPAFIDSHSHFSSVAMSFSILDLENAKNFNEIQDLIRKFIKDNHIKPGEFIRCANIDFAFLDEKTHPQKEILDEVSSSNPLVLSNKNGHVGVFNSLLLKYFGIDDSTKDPSGGAFERENGSLTGYAEENAYIENVKKIPLGDFETLVSHYEKAQALYSSFGITTVQEGMMVAALGDVYEALIQENKLYLDVVAYIDYKDKEMLTKRFKKHINRYDSHFKIGGIKIFLDGSPQSKTAWMKEPYSKEKEYCGYPTMKDDEVTEAILFATKQGMQILAHANGSAACKQFIDCVEEAAKKDIHVLAMRPVLIHAQLLDKADIEKAADLGIIASFFVAHVYHWGDIHIENFGKERADEISPVKSAKEAGMAYTFHQDSPVIMPDMLQSIWTSVVRTTKNGITLGEEEKIEVKDALRAVNKNGAYSYFEEKKKGSLYPGKNADFVLLSKNPLKIEPNEIKDIEVLYTIKNADVIYKKTSK